ncbi:MAG: GNAT family N-acetyltransferase [candidate division FCPU426 bacterium]
MMNSFPHPQPVLQTQRLSLRPFRLEDAADVRRLANERDVAAMTYRLPHPYPAGLAEEWIRGQEPAYREGRETVFALTLRDNGGLIGSMGLMVKAEHERAEVGYWLGKPYWGKGFATEALEAVLEYGFGTLGLRRIFGQLFAPNQASARVMEKAGMIYEGRLRQHVNKWGEYQDLRIYAMLADDPRPWNKRAGEKK